ncbi:hypothetical protein F5146DRAFT_1135622 [Armillaria mellea]|nr:hypothetical protein F5146DRAFT_1135622 [Armillaria mellea]
MASCNTTQMFSYTPTIDITPLLHSWCPPEHINEIMMAQIRLNVTTVDSLIQPRLDHIKELKSEIACLRTEIAAINPTLDKYHSLHVPICRLPPELLLSIFGHLESGLIPLQDDALAQLITLLKNAKQLASLQVDCRECLVPKDLAGSSIVSSLLELHLHVKVPKALSCISFPVLHSLTLGLPHRCPFTYTQMDVDTLNNLHCPHLHTLTLYNPINILSIDKLLLGPITRFKLVVRDNCVYHALNSMPLLHLEDLCITDESPSSSGKILMVVKAKKSLRNVEVKSASFVKIRELLQTESLPNELTITCWNALAQIVRPRTCDDGSSTGAVVV